MRFQKPMPQGEIAGLPRYGDGLIIARDPAALWTPLPQRSALDLVVKARTLVVQVLEESLAKYYADRLAVVRELSVSRGAHQGGARKGAASGEDAESTGVHQDHLEQSIDAEEASLMKELSPATGAGKSLADAKRALSEVTDWTAQLSPAEAAAPSCYASRRARRFAPDSRRPPWLVAGPRATQLRILQRRAATVGATGRDHHGHQALFRHRRQIYNVALIPRLPPDCQANCALIETMDKAAIRGSASLIAGSLPTFDRRFAAFAEIGTTPRVALRRPSNPTLCVLRVLCGGTWYLMRGRHPAG